MANKKLGLRFFVRPRKKVKDMTVEERRAFVDQLYEAMTNPKPRAPEAPAVPPDSGHLRGSGS